MAYMCDNQLRARARDADRRAEGVVVEPLPNALFRVDLASGQQVIAHVTLEARARTVRLLPGHRVAVEISSCDPSRARIVATLGKG